LVIGVDKSKMISKKNKKGWIRIAEAFIAVLLVIGIAIIVVGGGIQREDISEKVYDIEISILREIQLNNTLRSEILLTGEIIKWDDFYAQVPKTKNKIQNKMVNWLECEGKICLPENPCLLGGESEKSIYAQSVLITSTLDIFNPRQLKLFCWEK
jgi:hypothetical protein